MHQRDAGQAVGQSKFDGGAYETFRTFDRNRFHAERGGFGKTHLRHPHLFRQEFEEFAGFWRPLLPFDAGIDIFGILAEDIHIDFFRFFDRCHDSAEPTYRTEADIKVEGLPEGDVQRTDTAADRGCQRAFDPDHIFSESLHRLVG